MLNKSRAFNGSFAMARPLRYRRKSMNTEEMKMNAPANEARLAGFTETTDAIESTEGTRYAQNNLLSELPGVVFGVITLGYIVSSLLALA
jgi:hypothetical protein